MNYNKTFKAALEAVIYLNGEFEENTEITGTTRKPYDLVCTSDMEFIINFMEERIYASFENTDIRDENIVSFLFNEAREIVNGLYIGIHEKLPE